MDSIKEVFLYIIIIFQIMVMIFLAQIKDGGGSIKISLNQMIEIELDDEEQREIYKKMNIKIRENKIRLTMVEFLEGFENFNSICKFNLQDNFIRILPFVNN